MATIWFVSGETSSTPITTSTEGYIGSTSVALNASGSSSWNVPIARTWKWHTYIQSGSDWSSKSDTYGFQSNNIRRFIVFYRDGGNDTGKPNAYKIASGNTGSYSTGLQINLRAGIPNTCCPNAGMCTKDKLGRIWSFSEGPKNASEGDGGSRGAHALYTYANSCNSWKGGTDYWFFPGWFSSFFNEFLCYCVSKICRFAFFLFII